MSVGVIRNVIKSSDLPTSIHTFSDVQKVLNAGKETEMLTVGMEMDEVTVGGEPMVWQIGNIASGEVIFVPKWCLATTRAMNSTATNVGGWNSSALRTWLNGDFYNSLPSSVKPYVKDRTFQTSQGNGSTSLQSATDKIWLPREYEIFGARTYATETEHTQGGAEQFSIFSTSANRIKTQGKAGETCTWWESSPFANSNVHFCAVLNTGAANYYGASDAFGVAPCFRMTPDGGSVELVDINPLKEKNNIYCVGAPTGFGVENCSIPVCGYKKIAICNYNFTYGFHYLRFWYADGTYYPTDVDISSYSDTWSPYIDIPNECICVTVHTFNSTVGPRMYYSLLA